MTAYERFLAMECPPENGSVLWINTSEVPYTLNMRVGNEWQVLTSYDQKAMEKIFNILGEFTDPNNSVASILESIKEFLVVPTEEEIHAMFATN